MIKMVGSRIRGITITSILALFMLPYSESYCIVENGPSQPLHTCSNLSSAEVQTIINIYLDSEPRVEKLLLLNNNISVVDNSLFTSDKIGRLEELSISKCNVEFILIGSLDKLTNLYFLEILDNNLKSFDGMVLQGLKQLKKLHLKGNNLESIKNICAGAPNLLEVIISNGDIKSIPSTVFKNCTKLERLTISGVGLSNIDADFALQLTQLKRLNLTNNNLKNLKFLGTNNKTLQIDSLDVSHNQITEIEAELLRVSLSNLKTFNLTGNEISVFMKDATEQFTHNSLQNLYLPSNKISVINKNLFKYIFNKINVINLDCNPVENIETGAFQDLKHLHQLIIKNSLQNLKDLKKGMFDGLVELQVFDLSDVHIASIEKDTFKDLVSLDKLYLQNNDITELYNGTFNGLNKVKTFNLTNNQISVIDPGAFFGFNLLETLEPRSFFSGIKRIQTRLFDGLSHYYFKKLDLSHLGLQSLEELAFKGLFDLTELHLDNNEISILVENTFVGLEYLQQLNISRNKLVTIHKNAFAKLDKLTILDLSFNQITVLHLDTFNPVHSLRNLYLSYNKLTFTTPGLFRKLNYLYDLYLNNNDITHLKTHSFSGLEYATRIYLQGNNIRKIDSASFLGIKKGSLVFSNFLKDLINVETLETETFIGLDNLEYIDLSYKNLSRVNSRAFSGLSNLKEISFYHSNISNLSSNAFEGPYITDLNLDKNNLSYISSNVFENSRIEQLHLAGNMLENLTLGTFNPIQNLRKLYLNSSLIKHISRSNYEGNSSMLEFIDLSNNFISTLEEYIFHGMKYLIQIDLSRNPIKKIGQNIFLGSDKIDIVTISLFDFKLNRRTINFENVTTLIIKNSSITEIEFATFSGLNLTTLTITDNKIDLINSKAFYNLPNLVTLDLSNNQINVTRTNMFQDLPKLKSIDLSRNNLTTVNCTTFNNTESLKTLLLNNNQINNLEPGSFSSLTSLEKLDLSFNNLTSITKVGIFSPFKNIVDLNLSYNNLSVIALPDLFIYDIRHARSLNISHNNLNIRVNAGSFKNGKWEEMDIRYNAWECSNLFKLFQALPSVRFASESYSGSNINGIPCTLP